MHRLVAHPDTPGRTLRSVTAQVLWQPNDQLWLEFMVSGAGDVRLAGWNPTGRTDGLWQTTCFEMFLKPSGTSGYTEYNFSPSGQWAAYGFDDYRAGMQDFPIDIAPEIELTGNGSDTFWLAIVPVVPPNCDRPWDVALSAVIEESDGTKSYWALRHPPGKPDFHHPDCFALTLEAPPPA